MPSLLIVDDEPLACDMVKEMLADSFDDITLAADGDSGLAAYRAQAVDLVITDLVMPGKNGIDFILELKKNYPDCRIIAMSGGGGIAGRFEYLPIAKMIGAAGLLEKPFSTEALRELVNKVLGNS